MKKLLSIFLSITIILTMSPAVFAGEAASSTITVGVEPFYAPFEYYEDGGLTGFDIELMKRIGELIGYDINYVEMPFENLIPAVISGEIDCAISVITVTEERENVVDFTRGYIAVNITYKDADTETASLEEYAIAFPENSREKGSGDTNIYTLVDNALKKLIDDGTIEKLIEKYDINKFFDEVSGYDNIYYECMPIKTTVEDAKTAFDNPKSDDISEAVPAPSKWAEEAVVMANELGITDARPYNYQNSITREEFCELIYNVVSLVKGDFTVTVTDSFTDTKNSKILVLNALGIINGKSETEFAPGDFLTREEAATIIIRMINSVMPMPATEMWFEYDDIEEISEWASGPVQTISNLGFMNGVGNNMFAPKATFTTEQAIITLVRVYEVAEAAGIIEHSESSVINRPAAPPKLNVTETIEVDDFYINEAIKLVKESGVLASDKDFIGYYTANEEMAKSVAELAAYDFDKPSAIYYMAADKEQIIANIKALYGEESDGIDIEKLLRLNKMSLATLPALINASYGAQSLAALSVLTNSRGYMMPKDFTKDFALYLEYEGAYSAFVYFSEYGEGVISANMVFVINGDKDNIFSRLYEIVQVVGEDGITIAKVE